MRSNNPYQQRWRPIRPEAGFKGRPEALTQEDLEKLTQTGLKPHDWVHIDGLAWRLWQHWRSTGYGTRLEAINRAYRMYLVIKRKADIAAKDKTRQEARAAWKAKQKVAWSDGVYMPWADKIYTDAASARRDAAAQGYREIGDQGVSEFTHQQKRTFDAQQLRRKKAADATRAAIAEAAAIVRAGQYVH